MPNVEKLHGIVAFVAVSFAPRTQSFVRIYARPSRDGVNGTRRRGRSATPEISPETVLCVVQTALSDFYVANKLVVSVGAEKPAICARVTTDLYA